MTSIWPIGRGITLACGLAFLSACVDPSASIDRKMSEIRREQCGPLPNERQRATCIQQVNDVEDDALRRLDEARRQQAIQQTVEQVRVINQTGRQW
jgi:hypothetical protein